MSLVLSFETGDCFQHLAGLGLPFRLAQGVVAYGSRLVEVTLTKMTTKSRQSICGASVRIAAERAATARREADRLACEGCTKLAFKGPAEPSLLSVTRSTP
jgi:hypothetical protein